MSDVRLAPCPFCGGEERRDDLQRANAENAKRMEYRPDCGRKVVGE